MFSKNLFTPRLNIPVIINVAVGQINLATHNSTVSKSTTLNFHRYRPVLHCSQRTFSLKPHNIQSVRNFSISSQKSVNIERKGLALSGLRSSVNIHEIKKGLQLICDKERCIQNDPTTLRLKIALEKPLVILLPWLMSKPKHIRKYAQIYIDQGYDVLTISVTPWQVMWPKKGTQLVASDAVKFLANNVESNPLLLHGFSVGGYVWGECMVHMARDLDRYRSILNLFQGQIWDSAVDLAEIKIGLPKAMFPRNDTLRKALTNYMVYHMKRFHEQATAHYIRSSQMFHSTLVRKPALFLLSSSDPIGSVSSNAAVRQSWESLGMRCDWKCWDKSPHVGHFQKHRDDYVNKLYDFLQTLNKESDKKIRARI